MLFVAEGEIQRKGDIVHLLILFDIEIDFGYAFRTISCWVLLNSVSLSPPMNVMREKRRTDKILIENECSLFHGFDNSSFPVCDVCMCVSALAFGLLSAFTLFHFNCLLFFFDVKTIRPLLFQPIEIFTV